MVARELTLDIQVAGVAKPPTFDHPSTPLDSSCPRRRSRLLGTSRACRNPGPGAKPAPEDVPERGYVDPKLVMFPMASRQSTLKKGTLQNTTPKSPEDGWPESNTLARMFWQASGQRSRLTFKRRAKRQSCSLQGAVSLHLAAPFSRSAPCAWHLVPNTLRIVLCASYLAPCTLSLAPGHLCAFVPCAMRLAPLEQDRRRDS